MKHPESHPAFQEEAALRWCFLEDERDACVVVSERMELVYINAAGRALVPSEWFGKRCFEVLPVVDETCAFHCPKIRAVSEAVDVVYCEETVGSSAADCLVLGVGLIPLGSRGDDRARAVLLLRDKGEPGEESDFRTQLLLDAETVRRRIVSRFG